MPRDLQASIDQLGSTNSDAVRDAPAVVAVASLAHDAQDCALLLDALGLRGAAQTAHMLLGLGRLKVAQ
jgi:hypothetical protein